MNQADLIARITTFLADMEGIGAALLGGSHGRGEADDFSDVDVFVVVDRKEDIQPVLTEISTHLERIARMLRSRVLPNARTINSITMDWLRFDFTILSQDELGMLAREQSRPLFDRRGIVNRLPTAPEQQPGVSPEDLLHTVHEFIRVLGLSVVANGREDLIVAETGTNLLRDMLIRLMVLQNGPQPQRGVLALKRSLTSDQIAALEALPPLAPTWTAVLERTRAIAEEFLPRARTLSERLGAIWPNEFERVTLMYLEEKLGLSVGQ